MSDPEYMARYMLARYHRRRAAAIEKLGGTCGFCGATDNLEIDHRDYRTKSFDLGKAFAGFSETRLAAELEKCWLLCVPCHREKTRVDNAVQLGIRPRWQHGTLTGYRHCKCDPCREAKRVSNAAYRARMREAG